MRDSPTTSGPSWIFGAAIFSRNCKSNLDILVLRGILGPLVLSILTKASLEDAYALAKQVLLVVKQAFQNLRGL